MTLVTITGDTIRESVGRKDNRPWYAWAADYQDGNPGVITPRRSKPLIPSNGVLSFEIEAGISAWIENPDKQRYLVTIPLVDGSLWEVIEAGVAYPPVTSQQQLDAAVVKYIEEHRAQFGLIAVPVPDSDPPMAQWVRVDNGEAVGDPVLWSQVIDEAVAQAAVEAEAPAAVGQAAADMNPVPVPGPTPGKIAISFNGTTGEEFNPLPASWSDLVGLPAELFPDPDSVGTNAALLKNDARPWYGSSLNAGNVANSFGWAGTPDITPATTITANATFPLTNATIAVADLSQFGDRGSFTLGGKRVGFMGRSASTGPGDLTGCYSEPTATGTVVSGTAIGNTPTGFFGFTVYQRFGYDGRPCVGSTQGFGVVAAYRSPTLDDSAESGSFVVTMVDSGSPQKQHRTVTGGEMTAGTYGNWHLPAGYSGALTGGGARTYVSATDHVKNAIGFKISPQHLGFVDAYDGIWQSASGLQVWGTLNGSASLPQATVPVTGAFPPATPEFPVTVRVGANAQGVGGTAITYTGQSGGSLTGCTGGVGTWAAGSKITNFALGINMKDPVLSGAGFIAALSGWSASFSLALKGNNDSANSMISLTGPTSTEVPGGGLSLIRLNAGGGQTRPLIQAFDSSGSNRFSLSAGGAATFYGTPIIFQQSGVESVQINSIGFIRPGITTSASVGKATEVGPKIYGGSNVPPTALIGVAGLYTEIGDLYIRKDGGVGSTVYRCTTVNGSNPPTSVAWTAIL